MLWLPRVVQWMPRVDAEGGVLGEGDLMDVYGEGPLLFMV